MKLNILPIDELITAASKGSKKHLDFLIKMYEPIILRQLSARVRQPCDVYDLLQKVNLRIFEQFQRGSYTHENKFVQWLSSITHHVTINYFREKKRQRNLVEPMPQCYIYDEPESLSSAAEDENMYWSEALADYFMYLPAEQAEVVFLKCFKEKTFREISMITGISINTVMGRYRYGLEKLRKMILEEQEKYGK